MHSTRVVSRGWSVLALALLLVGCGGENASSGQNGWTVDEGALTLERDLLVGDDEEFYFGSIADVGVDNEGQMYVADREAHHLKVLASDGELLKTVGEEGEGPGEFRMPRALALARGDSLYVYDIRSRLSVFEPDTHAFSYSVQVDRIPERPGFYLMHVPENGDDVMMAFHPQWGSEAPIGLYRVGYDGVPADSPIVRMPPEEYLVETKGGIPIRSTPKPFGRAPTIALGPEGQIYQGYSDSLVVNVYTLDGIRQDRWRLPYNPVPVSKSVIQNRLESAGEAFRPLLREAGFPKTKPAFESLVTDDQGRFWFKRPTADPDRADWWVADPDGKQVWTTSLPARVDLRVIKKGQAYGQTTTEDGAPALVRYRVRYSSN